MSKRPSDGMELDELRDEFDWMFEFQSRMAKRIRNDPNVHNLADYVAKLESENRELRELMYDRAHRHAIHNMTEDELRITATNAMDENSSLREILSDLWDFTGEQLPIDEFERRFKELGVHA